MGGMPTTIPADLAEIVAIEDARATLRNLLITQRYHDLSFCLRETIGGNDANWSTFATWASKTAGENIRGDEVSPFVRDLVERGTRHEQHDVLASAVHHLVPGFLIDRTAIADAVRVALADVSTQIAGGNREVFEELAPLFAGFCHLHAPGAVIDDDAFGRFLAGLRPGPVERSGQGELRRALMAYRKAMRTDDPALRARLMLMGNVLIGFHEQARLQPWIRHAMDAPVADTLVAGLRRTVRDVLPRGLDDWAVRKLDGVIESFAAVLEQEWNEIAGRYFMSLVLPGGKRLVLGADIPPLAGGATFPALLLTIADPAALVRLIHRFDRSNDEGAGSASHDWVVLSDRMNFILNLFRSRQCAADLFDQPFSDRQRAEIEEHRVPRRRLGPL
jgi:hypothetical protein